MKLLEKLGQTYRYLIFMDLEATQISAEMIEIGAYWAAVNEKGEIAKVGPSFTHYVKPHSAVGPVVTKMTGITNALLSLKGEPFPLVLQELKSYLGRRLPEACFVFFGNQDLRILAQSLHFNPEGDRDLLSYIEHHHLDFSAFLSRYVKDPLGNPYSLANYLKIFNLDFEGRAHDALADALNLLDLYRAFYQNTPILEREYMKTLSHQPHLPSPIAKVIKSLNDGETVTPEQWASFVKGSFK